MINYLKRLYNNDKDNFKVAGFIILAVLALTYYFKAYLLGFAFGPQKITPEELASLKNGGLYQHYISFEATEFLETDQVLTTQTTQKGRVIDEDYEGQFILVPVDQNNFMAVNVATLPSEGKKTYEGFLFDDLQYSLPYWAENMSLDGKVLTFYLDSTKRPLWWVITIWAAAVIFCVVVIKELAERLPKEKL